MFPNRSCLPLFVLCFCVGCPTGTIGDNETIGREGIVKFGADTKLAFTQRIVTGSKFIVSFEPVDTEETNLAGATLRGSDEDVIAISEGTNARNATVTLTGPGTADLEVVQDGNVIDHIELHSGIAGATALVDGSLFLATDTVDARLPQSFAIRTDTEHQLFITAVDKCGGDLIDLGASTIENADGVPTSIETIGPAQFTVATQVAGDIDLVLKTPNLADLTYTVKSVDPNQVDEVTAAVSATDESGGAVMWGRAFVDDVELIGDLQYSWTADPRVTLAAAQGTAVGVTVSFPLEGEPPDDRPATVTAEVFGEAGTVDLLTVTQAVTSRGAPARELEVKEEAPSCGGGAADACNPEAALGIALGIGSLRRLRRQRLRTAAE